MNAIRSILVALSIALTTLAGADALPVAWSHQFNANGPDDVVRSLVRWQGDVVIGGEFGAVGRVAVPSHVARRRDGAWEALGESIAGTEVRTLAIHDDALHAIVEDAGTYRVMRFDGDAWQAVGAPLPSSTPAMVSFQGDLYVGAYRLEAGVWVNRLQTDGAVRSLVVMEDLLVAGGGFTSGQGQETGHVLGWDGTQVVAAFNGQVSFVVDLAVWNGQLFAARSISYPSAPAVQVWQDGSWIDIPQLGDGSSARHVTDLEAGGDRLLVCGYWESFIAKGSGEDAGSRSAWGSFARSWDGVASELLGEEEGFVEFRQILADGDGVLVAGDFVTRGQASCANLGRIVAGATVRVCEPGFGASGSVRHLCPQSTAMAVGGAFEAIGGIYSRDVAIVQADAWWPCDLGNGEDLAWYDGLRSLNWHHGDLYAVADGHMGSGAGYWNGSQWIMTGQQDGYLTSGELLSFSGMLLGEGDWNGVIRYSSLENPTVYADVDRFIDDIMVHDGELVVGGEFELIAGTPAANVAVRRGGAWQALGGGLPERVRTLGSWQGDVVAVTQGADSNTVYRLVDGQWVELGALAAGLVNCVAEYANALFVGGSFTSPADDGTPMIGIACWTGTGWVSVGEAATVSCLAVHDGKLWLGGSFHFAGGVPAWHLSTLQADDILGVESSPPPVGPALRVTASPNPFNPRTVLRFELPAASRVRIEAFDARGHLVATLVEEDRAAGTHAIAWNGCDDRGRPLPSGTYLLRLEAASRSATIKAVLVR